MNIKLKQKQTDTTDNALKQTEHKSFFLIKRKQKKISKFERK